MNSLWIEVKKFIKNNIKKIIIYTIVLGTILGLILFFMNRRPSDSIDSQGNSNTETSVAYFQYYSEREDGSALTNLSVVREYFSREEIIEDWADEFGVPKENIAIEDEFIFTDEVELALENNQEIDEEEVIFEEDQDIVNLNMYKGDYSHLFTLTITSQDEQLSLDIAEYYYELLENNEIPFYHDKNVYIFKEPKISENLIRVDDTVEIELTESNSISVINIIVGYILSFAIVTGIIVIQSLFSKKLSYSFSYLWDEKHLFLLFDPKQNNKNELTQFLSYPDTKEKVILSENEVSETLSKLLSQSLLTNKGPLPVYNNVTDFNMNQGLEEIIILVNEGETSRKWYKEQQNLLSIYNHALVKIVQINK